MRRGTPTSRPPVGSSSPHTGNSRPRCEGLSGIHVELSPGGSPFHPASSGLLRRPWPLGHLDPPSSAAVAASTSPSVTTGCTALTASETQRALRAADRPNRHKVPTGGMRVPAAAGGVQPADPRRAPSVHFPCVVPVNGRLRQPVRLHWRLSQQLPRQSRGWRRRRCRERFPRRKPDQGRLSQPVGLRRHPSHLQPRGQ